MAQKSKKYQSLAAVAIVFGVVASPAVAGAATDTTTITSDIGSAITITSDGSVTADVTPTSSAAQTIASDTVTVNTNNSAGYTLQLADSDATNTLASGGNSLPALGGTVASPVAQTANTWGFRVDGQGGFGAGPTSSQNSGALGSVTFAGVPASSSPVTIRTTSSVASNDDTTVWYGVAANNTQPTGTYSGQVTYTATAN